MQILVVFCHPSRESFVGAILTDLVARLERDGHDVQVADIYAEGFDPVLQFDAWRAHRDNRRHSSDADAYVAALRAADGLVFVYPTWWYGLPAMLKGWIDRVFQPEVAFLIENGAFRLHYLPKLRRFAAVTTYGSPRLFIEWLVGDPVRRQLLCGLALQYARGVHKCWAPIYHVDGRSQGDLSRAKNRAVERVARLFGPHDPTRPRAPTTRPRSAPGRPAPRRS